ncbi:MAG: nicotinate (nicotinamide) nucleotide adenylyltransferase [Treponemataceae bacterium]|nr:nicotinate (nicotinamide) nucleotide adenylyltransferase [Treponemataceae bacterium]
MKIAVFGGSFNPVHNGHIAAARSVHEEAGYRTVVFVPAFHSPFKELPGGATNDDRIRMLELANKNKKAGEWAKIETCEILRGGISYTIDTIRFLTEKYRTNGILDPNEKLGFILGSDLVEGFPHWKNADALARESDLILVQRPVENREQIHSNFVYPHISVENRLFSESSTQVRENLQNRETFKSLVAPSVYEYIIERNLYSFQAAK